METQMKLEHKFELRWLILLSLPTIFSNIFGNLYTEVDGIFVARFVDTDALSAINISMPMAYLASAVGMMFQLSFITVDKAGLGAFLSVLGGVLNIALDWLFMGVFGWGLTGLPSPPVSAMLSRLW